MGDLGSAQTSLTLAQSHDTFEPLFPDLQVGLGESRLEEARSPRPATSARARSSALAPTAA